MIANILFYLFYLSSILDKDSHVVIIHWTTQEIVFRSSRVEWVIVINQLNVRGRNRTYTNLTAKRR